MEPAQINALALRLNGDQPPRVWSLLVTVFGELAQDDGAKISGLTLRLLMDLIGIRSEATRVALHRLRNEGWIDSTKTGRRSDYFLTPLGRQESMAASPLIYAATPAAASAWLVLTPMGQPRAKGIPVSSDGVITNTRPQTSDALSFELASSTALPDWVTSQICDATLIAQTQVLAETLETLSLKSTVLGALPAPERMVLRILLVHAWRRIILKAPRLPDHLFPTDWQGPACRAGLADMLASLPKTDQLDPVSG